MLRLRAALNADESAPKISLLAMLSRYTILGLHRYPELNARIEGDEIVMGPPVHLGFAAQTDRGLMVPVVPRCPGAHPGAAFHRGWPNGPGAPGTAHSVLPT